MNRRTGFGRLLLACAIVVTAVTASVAVGAGRAEAHALLTSSTPSDGSTLKQSPTEIIATFTERPDPNLSSIKVLDTAGQTRAGGKPKAVAFPPNSLRISVGPLPNGSYTVTWRTVSKIDGHVAAGAFSFGVGVAPARAAGGSGTVGTSRTPRPSGLALAARWLFFAGVLGLVGMAFVELVLLPHLRPPPGGVALWLALWIVTALGVLGVTEAQRRAADVPLGDVLSSSLGHSLIERGVPTLFAGAAVGAVAVLHGRGRRIALAALLAGVGLVMLADVATGHAAATAGWEWFRIATQWVHFAAAALWIGGLGALLVALRRLDPELRHRAVHRFSTAAGIALMAVATTGVLRAYDEVGSWHGLFRTGFGQTVIVKVGLLAVLAGLGAVNRYRSLPAAARTTSWLRRVGRAELGVAAAVLIAAALLQNLAPARSAAAASGPALPVLKPLVLDGHDFGTTTKVRLTITPGTAGPNQFSLAVTDYDTGKPVTADAITLRFALPARPDVGESTLAFNRAADGSYQNRGGNLSIVGTWTLTVIVQRGIDSVEIPLQVTTALPPQRVDVLHSRGLPDIFTVHLQQGRTVQIYLDPSHPGLDEFHATFFASGGNELPIANYAATATGPGLAGTTTLATRRLDPGHFVSDLQAQLGTYHLTVVAVSQQGDPLAAVIDMKVRR